MNVPSLAGEPVVGRVGHVTKDESVLKAPAWRSSSVPKTLGESKRGTQSQSTAPLGAISAPVWQFEMNE